jgi:catecholate siderophore receptor
MNRHQRLALRPVAAQISAIVAGLGFSGLALAQATPPEEQRDDKVMPTVRARAKAEPTGKDSLKTDTTTTAKGRQELRDVPQSITVVTEKLIDDRHLDTLKETLKNASGVTFQAAEGGEEDIRLRGFSLQASGDIFIDGMRDPAFYERDSFNWDRLEVLRGSASLLFGRGSTGGAVNQVSKQPFPTTQNEVEATLGTAGYLRLSGDFNVATGADSAFRVTVMGNGADNDGAKIDKRGIAPTFRWGIGGRDEFQVGLYYLQNDNNIHYGLPWLTPGPNKGGDWLWPTDPGRAYMMASDRSHSGTTQASASHTHRFGNNQEIKTALRVAEYRRDQRASAIRFAPAALQPDGQAVTSDTFSDATVLNRSGGTGTSLKVMNMDTAYLQSDYSGRHQWAGMEHAVQAGVDVAVEKFRNYGLDPSSPVLTKPRTTVGTPDDGASVDESRRILLQNRNFENRAIGAYAQDLVKVAPMWKLLAGLRWDKLDGDHHAITAQGSATTGNPPVANPCFTPAGSRYARNDSLWSKRFGVLFQPTPLQSYHLSYGTSFNTSGDTYQYDNGTANTAPESSRNLELGAKIDSEDGGFTMRAALFHSTKYNERNRDAESVDACNYVLSGKRHAAGVELDLAGRITPQWEVYFTYAYIPVAKVDSSSGAAGAEVAGSRPGLTPRHTGTLWSTYQVTPAWRFGAGLNARSSDVPVGLAAGSQIKAPSFITADLMAEYRHSEQLVYKANLTNVTDKHYADYLYRGHYVPGRPRTLLVSVGYRFD